MRSKWTSITGNWDRKQEAYCVIYSVLAKGSCKKICVSFAQECNSCKKAYCSAKSVSYITNILKLFCKLAQSEHIRCLFHSHCCTILKAGRAKTIFCMSEKNRSVTNLRREKVKTWKLFKAYCYGFFGLNPEP
jgi:hypothetical protein